MVDLPPDIQERAVCQLSLLSSTRIPANILLAIAEKEGGNPVNGYKIKRFTHDVGAMQFNTAYLQDLSKYGITTDHVAQAGCYAYDLAAWRVRQHIKNDKGDIWTKAANYHSRTPEYNAKYRADLIVKAAKVGKLAGRTVLYEA